MGSNTPRGTPARVLILFALLSGLVVVAAFRDSQNPGAFTVSYPTATGDTACHRPGTEPPLIAAGGFIYALEESGEDILKRRDDRMWRVPLAVPTPRLYTPSSTWPAGEIPPLYLKTGEGEYLRVLLRKATAQSSPAVDSQPPGPDSLSSSTAPQ